MSLMSKYKKEYFGIETLEDDKGFCTFSMNGDNCYIEDVFVVEEERNKGVASMYVDVVSQVAKDKGCKNLITTVNLGGLTPDRSMSVILSYGFKPTGFFNNCFTFAKEIV